jgi:hypothetical protein
MDLKRACGWRLVTKIWSVGEGEEWIGKGDSDGGVAISIYI